MKTRHVDCPRSAIIVFRFLIIFGEVFSKASYADIAYAAQVRLPTLHILSLRVSPWRSQPPFLHDRSKSFVLFVPLPAADPFRGYNTP